MHWVTSKMTAKIRLTNYIHILFSTRSPCVWSQSPFHTYNSGVSFTSKRKDMKPKLTGFRNPGASEYHFADYTQHIAYWCVLVTLVNIPGFALQRRSLTKFSSSAAAVISSIYRGVRATNLTNWAETLLPKVGFILYCLLVASVTKCQLRSSFHACT